MKGLAKAENVTFEHSEVKQYSNTVKTQFICQVFFVYLGICGFISAFLSSFSVGKSENICYLIFIPICILILFLYTHRQMTIYKRIVNVLACILILLGIICFHFLRYSFMGLLVRMNIGISSSRTYSPLIFLIYISIYLIYLLSYLINRQRKMMAAIVMLLPVIIPLCFGYSPELLPLVLITMFLIGQSVVTIGKERSSRQDQSSLTAVVIAIAIFLLYIVIHFVYLEVYFDHHKPFQGVSENIDSFWENNIAKSKPQSSAVGGLNKGALGQVDKIEYRDITMLKLTSGFLGPMYLRSYVGSTYDHNQWNSLSDQTREDAMSMFEQFRVDEFDVYNLQNVLFRIIDNDDDLINTYLGKTKYINQVYRRNFEVIYQKADWNFWYLPYNSNLTLRDIYYDDYPQSNEKGQIDSVNYYIEDIDYDRLKQLIEGYDGDNPDMVEYQDLEKIYRNYVYQNYTGVDNTVDHEIKNAVNAISKSESLSGIESYTQTSDKLAYVQAIKNYFKHNYHYTLNPGKVPEGEDFVSYFLNETGKGYCTHFATAAALILRKAGIPARYVEGYKADVRKEDSIQSKLVNGFRKSKVLNEKENYYEYTINVTDRSAHAWVEIYADGIGWIPIEVTPSDQDNDPSVGMGLDKDSNSEDEQNSNSENEMIAETEPYIEKEVETSANDEEAVILYRDKIFKKYHTLTQYLFNNNKDAIDFVVAGRLLKRDSVHAGIFLVRAIIVLVILSILIYVPVRIREHERMKIMEFHIGKTNEEYEHQLLKIYRYIERLGRYYKVVRKNTMPYLVWAEKLSDSNDCFADHDIKQVVQSIIKITFSKDQLSEDEIRTTIENVKEIQHDSYVSLSKLDRIRYRFIYNLK